MIEIDGSPPSSGTKSCAVDRRQLFLFRYPYLLAVGRGLRAESVRLDSVGVELPLLALKLHKVGLALLGPGEHRSSIHAARRVRKLKKGSRGREFCARESASSLAFTKMSHEKRKGSRETG